jgi:hypothetical protein
VVQSRIVQGIDQRRKFLLIAKGAAANATLTINFDGVAVGSVVATRAGKLMLRSLEGDSRLAGVQILTITDAAGAVIGLAAFFPTAQ